jgi:hypothetical protein
MSRVPLHPPNQVVGHDRERDLLVKGGILSQKSVELVARSRTVIARSRLSIAESGRRMDGVDHRPRSRV